MTSSQGQDTSEALAVTLHDHFDGRITLRVAQPQPQYGTVQLNAEYKGNLISVDVNAKALLDALALVAPADHQRALAAERERIAEAIEALRPAHYGSEDEPHDTGFTRARDEAAHIARAAIARGNPHTEESP